MSKSRFVTVSAICLTASFLVAPISALAEENNGRSARVMQANPNEAVPKSKSAAQRVYRPRPKSSATVAAKAAADRRHAREMKQPSELSAPSARAPVVVGGVNIAGLRGGTANTGSTPPDNEGAVGPTRYIQTVNTAVRIIDRATNGVVGSGSLNQLAQNPASTNSFDPQIMWDATTNRFYYAMDSIFSSTDNRIAFGFSKSASPNNVTTDWCHYVVFYDIPFPDYPKLGDSKDFLLIGVNTFANNSNGGYIGSDIIAINKPIGTATVSTCPNASIFNVRINSDLRDTGGFQVFTPVPSDQIDNNNVGYVVAVDGSLPATKLWFYDVRRNTTSGLPVFRAARSVTVPSYNFPPNATQSNGRLIDTSDARHTQAVQAINPLRGPTIHSFWTQHTVASAGFSGVRWYEINPATPSPTLLQTGIVNTANAFSFNGAISPDRKNDGTTSAFGNSFVIQYNVASTNIPARIVVRSSFNGGAISAPLTIKSGIDAYADFSCDFAGDICRWGDYAAAVPDPVPTAVGRGVVWSTNQFSGVLNPSTAVANWRTQIFAVQP